MLHFLHIVGPAQLLAGTAHQNGTLGPKHAAIGHGVEITLGRHRPGGLVHHGLCVGLQFASFRQASPVEQDAPQAAPAAMAVELATMGIPVSEEPRRDETDQAVAALTEENPSAPTPMW